MVWLVTALVAAAALRFAALGQKPLWCDELASLQRLSLSFSAHVQAMKGNHPLFELLLRLWMPPDGSDAWMRIPSAALGVAAVWMTWLLVRGLGARYGLVAAWLMALSPLHVMYSRIARPYSLACTLALASTLALIWAIRRRSVLSFAAYAVATALLVYANLFAASLWLAQVIFLLWFHRRRLRRLAPWVVANLAVAALIAPWMWYSARRRGDVGLADAIHGAATGHAGQSLLPAADALPRRDGEPAEFPGRAPGVHRVRHRDRRAASSRSSRAAEAWPSCSSSRSRSSSSRRSPSPRSGRST